MFLHKPSNKQTLSLRRRLHALHEQGMNLPELSATVAVVGVMAAIMSPMLTQSSSALNDTMTKVEGNFKLARSKAMSQTKAFRITPQSNDKFVMQSHNANAGSNIYSCADAGVNTDSDNKAVWQSSHGFNLDEDMALEEGVKIKSVTIDGTVLSDPLDWELCFDARGMANKNLVLELENEKTGATKKLEVFSGGSLVAYESARYSNGNSSPLVEDPEGEDSDDDGKVFCNNGEGNGSEGCSSSDSENANNDESLTEEELATLAQLENDGLCNSLTYEGVNVQVCANNGQKSFVSLDYNGQDYKFAFLNEPNCGNTFTSGACSAIYAAKDAIGS